MKKLEDFPAKLFLAAKTGKARNVGTYLSPETLANAVLNGDIFHTEIDPSDPSKTRVIPGTTTPTPIIIFRENHPHQDISQLVYTHYVNWLETHEAYKANHGIPYTRYWTREEQANVTSGEKAEKLNAKNQLVEAINNLTPTPTPSHNPDIESLPKKVFLAVNKFRLTPFYTPQQLAKNIMAGTVTGTVLLYQENQPIINLTALAADHYAALRTTLKQIIYNEMSYQSTEATEMRAQKKAQAVRDLTMELKKLL